MSKSSLFIFVSLLLIADNTVFLSCAHELINQPRGQEIHGSSKQRIQGTDEQGIQGVRQRADCAELQLRIALGERVSASRRAQCERQETPATPPPLVRPKLATESGKSQIPDLFKDVRPSRVASPPQMEHTRAPSWINRLPSRQGIFYGVGQGTDLPLAFRRAVTVIAGQVQTHIRSISNLYQSESSKERDGHRTTSSKTYVSESSQMIVRGVVDQVKIEDQYTNTETNQVWVLAKLDVAAIRKQEDALVRSVYQILERAASRLQVFMSKDQVLDQSALFEMISVLDEVKTLGRSRLGRKVRHRWEHQFNAFRRLVEKITDCLHVKGNFRFQEKVINAQGFPRIDDNTEMQVVLFCKKIPIVNGKFNTHVTGGITSIPSIVETDDKGRASGNLGAVFGRGKIKIGFTHALRDLEGAQWLGRISPSQYGTIGFTAPRPARMSIHLTGISGEIKRKVLAALETLVGQKWGAQIVNSSSSLSASCRVNYGNVSPAGGKYAVPVEISFVVSSAGGKIFEKKAHAGSLANSPAQARTKALTNLLRAIQRW